MDPEMEERGLLQHSKSDESLFDDVKHVFIAPRPLLSHLVGSRSKEDREELQRILTHLPSIREVRANRAANKGKVPAVDAALDVLGVSETNDFPKAPTPRGVTPRNSTPRAANYMPPRSAPTPTRGTPRSAGTPRSGSAPSAHGSRSSRGATPRGVTTPRGAYPQFPAALSGSPIGTPQGATPRSRGNTPQWARAAVTGSPALQSPSPVPPLPPPSWPPQDVAPTSQEEPSPPSSAAERAALETKKAMELRGDKQMRKTCDEKKAQAEATQRVIEKLAEFGIDPEGMSATDILRIFYTRFSGSSYWLANREAEKRLNIRASTPKSFIDVLKPTAEAEIRRARDLPVTRVHEYLDQWEIAFLGDQCRSLRCFGDAAEGHTTEYMRKYTTKQYGTKSGRRAYVRPQT